MIKKGDRVKLTERVVRSKGYQRHKDHIDWHARRGVVTRATAKIITIRWEGRRSEDHWPPQAVELDPKITI
jgi:hypothetical protein